MPEITITYIIFFKVAIKNTIADFSKYFSYKIFGSYHPYVRILAIGVAIKIPAIPNFIESTTESTIFSTAAVNITYFVSLYNPMASLKETTGKNTLII